MREVETITKRHFVHKTEDGKLIVVKSKTIESNHDFHMLCKWNHCLYLSFKKTDFPNFKYPEFLPPDEYFKKGRFDYYESDFAKLDFHGGITFYRESVEDNHLHLITIGCDYQHAGDELTYGRADCGHKILTVDGEGILKEFLELYQMRLK